MSEATALAIEWDPSFGEKLVKLKLEGPKKPAIGDRITLHGVKGKDMPLEIVEIEGGDVVKCRLIRTQ